MNKWLSYYHPSTIAFIDDEQTFLNAIKLRLPPNSLPLFFNDAQKGLSHILESKPQHESLEYISEVENFEIDHSINNEAFINIKLGNIHQKIYNRQRFSEISVVIVDKKMPEMDGIDFCRNLIDKPIKKIMLTASKDHRIATEAFNEGIIDFFLPKDTPDLISRLMVVIENLQKEYFEDLNHSLLNVTRELSRPLVNNNDDIINFVQTKIMQLDAAEYYLLDRWGSTLFIKSDGTPITLIISPEKIIENYAMIAMEHEHEYIANLLFSKQKLIFFPNEVDCMRPVKDWSDFIFNASPLPGDSNLFYTMIFDPLKQPVIIEKIFSSHNYSINLT